MQFVDALEFEMCASTRDVNLVNKATPQGPEVTLTLRYKVFNEINKINHFGCALLSFYTSN